ncbi:MAG: putative polyferredoxin [Bacillales bacterium]|jgi:ferredoxin|nr:putative polyferredoxin [Bacillales bacterium]
MNGVIIYFSGTGNTKLIVNNFNKVFQQKNITLDILSIEKNADSIHSKYDFIIIGFPNYFGRAPTFFLNYLKEQVPNTNESIPVGIFCTESIPDSTSFKEVEEIMLSKNYQILLNEHFHMPNNLNIDEVTKIVNGDVVHEKIFSKINLFAENLSLNRKSFEIPNKVSQAFPSIFDNLLVDMNLCIKCRFCLRCCPFDNIILDHQKIKILDNCANCMRCVNICPKNAINFSDKKIKQYKENIGLVIK